MKLKQAWNRVPMSTGEKVSYMMGAVSVFLIIALLCTVEFAQVIEALHHDRMSGTQQLFAHG